MRLASRLIVAVSLFAAAPAAAAPSFATKELGVRVSSAAIQASDSEQTYPMRVYYIRDSTAVYSATTADGLTLVEEADIRLSTNTQPPLDVAISSITGLTIQPILGGGWRMLYSIKSTTGAYRIYTATSADGLAWANSTGAVVDAGTTFAGFPSVVTLASGDWRLFYIQNTVAGGSSFANNAVFTALSTDQGRNFGAPSLAINTVAGHVSATKLTNDKIRVYYTAPPAAGVSTHTTVLSALSRAVDGAVLDVEAGIRLSTGSGQGELSRFFVVRSTDGYRWRMYYDFAPFQNVDKSTPDAWSAVTDSPDIQSINPSTVLRTTPAQVFTITGEVFSGAPDADPTARLTRSGQADILGTALNRVDDQTLQVTFDTQNSVLGHWNLAVVNDNTLETSLANAVLVDFAGGDVRVVGNLLRPRENTPTTFTVTINNDGVVSLKVYTIDGRQVATLMEQHLVSGTYTFTWDGRTSDGRVAASGVYVMRARGPKLDALNKIVLIK